MREKPILFSAPMVRAVLAGTKTQTRRVVKPRDLAWMDEHQGLREPDNAIRCPYGQPGDRLWVREAHYLTDNGDDEYAVYAADSDDVREHLRSVDSLSTDFPADIRARHRKLRPSIHMPRWASRITLEITAVHVERLQDISEADAKAEGCEPLAWDIADGAAADLIDLPLKSADRPYANAYALLWDSINGPGAWAANPWVWCVAFQKVAP